MKEIPIYRDGDVIAQAKVDDTDYERLSRGRWKLSPYGYAIRKASKGLDPDVYGDGPYCPRVLFMHREVLGLRFGDGVHTDHLNHDRLDNRRENLRACTLAENNANVPPGGRRGSSRYRGVCYRPQASRRNPWVAMCCGEYLGLFSTEIDAALAAARRRREVWPELPEPLLDGERPVIPDGPLCATTAVSIADSRRAAK